ncbi:cytochrome c oxidase assembly protein [Mesorhizobium sp. ES1-3]|uniref:cytochrome c oxidase assembly protein n=1 Tax=Mesorhizobium sp. ES1-3 TaxID=2876628 RepID=UPI001CCA67E3|nr:cytochrome c oxidase assembly protein [Mesorhizobium sp. ES1-3]
MPGSRAVSWANASLLAGVSVLAGLWLGPLVALSRTAFSPHMLLHLGVVIVAAPLLAFGLALHRPPLAAFGNALSWCLLAVLFEMVAVWGWHIPLLHDAAGRSTSLFVLEQASFLFAGLFVWTVAFAARNRETAPAAAIAMFLTFTHMTMFGLVLTLAPILLYDPDLCRGAFGLDRLQDQHLGGVLMAVGGGVPYLIGTVWALSNMLGEKTAGHTGPRPSQ